MRAIAPRKHKRVHTARRARPACIVDLRTHVTRLLQKYPLLPRTGLGARKRRRRRGGRGCRGRCRSRCGRGRDGNGGRRCGCRGGGAQHGILPIKLHPAQVNQTARSRMWKNEERYLAALAPRPRIQRDINKILGWMVVKGIQSVLLQDCPPVCITRARLVITA